MSILLSIQTYFNNYLITVEILSFLWMFLHGILSNVRLRFGSPENLLKVPEEQKSRIDMIRKITREVESCFA